MNRDRFLLVVSGPSGVGKDTVVRRMRELHGEVGFSVSATTRAPRENEQDGVDYHFLSRERFLEWIDRNAFLEYAEFVGNLYGTPKKYVDEAMDSGKDVILDIEVQGAEQVPRQRPDVVRIFIAPPSWEEEPPELSSPAEGFSGSASPLPLHEPEPLSWAVDELPAAPEVVLSPPPLMPKGR